ncbi:MAG: hypothetical protein HFE85_00385 [Clostridiales bacterium]|nr:hypothetical protein [Clostridiales bacterium]
MNEKLRRYVEELFKEAPQTKKAIELKEEMIQNLQEKYQDLVREGKSEEAAYNIAVASIGDISVLLDGLREHSAPDRFTQEMMMKSRNRSAILVSIAVMLYILCVLPAMFLDSMQGPALMFIMIAVATGLLVFNNMTKPRRVRMDDTVVEEFREWKAKNSELNQVMRSVSAALWALTIALYFIISFTTMAWYVTWVIFLLAGAIQAIIKAVLDLKKAGRS